MARVLFAILLGVAVTACAQAEAEPEIVSMAEPDTTDWAGVISGEGCDSYGIEITIDKNGAIVGSATNRTAGTLWDVRGIVISHSVQMRLEIQAQGYVRPVMLIGDLIGSSLSISELSGVDCDPARSGILEPVIPG